MQSFDAFQMFGTAQGKTGEVRLMLCKDVDDHDEVTVHHYSPAHPGGAFTCKVERSGQKWSLRPTVLWDVAPDGKTLVAPPLSAERMKERDESSATLVQTGEGFEGHWRTPDGFVGKISLSSKFPVPDLHLNVETISSWSEFKLWVDDVRKEIDAASFRGHGSNNFKLQTSFHRAGLHRIERFMLRRLPEFSFHAEAVLNEKFDMRDSHDLSTVLGLAQHHGLPTPMLDWTGSPYVAAFFAFSDALQEQAARTDVSFVRVFALSKSFMNTYSPEVVAVRRVAPFAEWLQISARSNPRLYMQRGQFLVTNVADLENLLLAIERSTGGKLLRCVDIPVSCSSEALEDLEFMGLSAAALFPGLDGVCRMMRHQLTYRGARPAPAAVGITAPAGANEDFAENPPRRRNRARKRPEDAGGS